MTPYEVIKENADWLWENQKNGSFLCQLAEYGDYREDKFEELKEALSKVKVDSSNGEQLFTWVFNIHTTIRDCLIYNYHENDSYNIDAFPEYDADKMNPLISNLDSGFYQFYKNLLPTQQTK